MNKAVFSIGAFLSLLAFGGIFFFGQMVSPPPVIVMAARVDIPVGTRLVDIQDTDLVRLPLRGDATLLSSLLTEADYTRFRQTGTVLAETVHAHEPIPKSALISSANDTAPKLQSLRLSDPDLMIVRLVVGDNAPEVHEGDLVDLGLAVAEVQSPSSEASVLSLPPVTTSSFLLPPGTGSENPVETATPTVSPTPTLTPTPQLLGPIAKTIVHAAVVTNLVRESPYPAGSDPGAVPAGDGKITAMDVIIPRETFEMVTMAASAGKLTIGLLSPLADRKNGPTMGASMQDFLDWFYADREKLAPRGEGVGTQPEEPTTSPGGSVPSFPGTATPNPTGTP